MMKMSDERNTGFDTRMFEEEVKLTYKGPIDERILSSIGDYISTMEKFADATSVKKLFKIFLELAQNISFYSAVKVKMNDNREIGMGTLVLKEFDDSFFLLTGNPVMNDNIISILEKSEYINSLDRESLRQYKRDERRRPQGEKGNAHIGLITVALTSSNPLDVEVSPIDDDKSFFSIGVKIDK